MKDKEKLLNSEFTFTYKILKSKDKTLILPPISGFDVKLTALSINNSEINKTDFMFTESNDKIIFLNLNTNSIYGFDIDELNLDKIYFRGENGRYATFEVQDIKLTDDLQLLFH